MAKTDDREKMLAEVFSKRRSFSNIYNDSVDILKDTESELNKILMQNQKDLEEMTKNFHYSDEDLKKLKSDIEKDFNISIHLDVRSLNCAITGCLDISNLSFIT